MNWWVIGVINLVVVMVEIVEEFSEICRMVVISYVVKIGDRLVWVKRVEM